MSITKRQAALILRESRGAKRALAFALHVTPSAVTQALNTRRSGPRTNSPRIIAAAKHMAAALTDGAAISEAARIAAERMSA